MELIPNNLTINWMKYRWWFIASSFALVAYAIYAWFSVGQEKWGLDFTGGTEVVARFSVPTDAGEVRGAVEGAGLGEATVQGFADDKNEFSIRVKSLQDDGAGDKIVAALRTLPNRQVEVLKQDYVGPIIGEQIKKDGVMALVWALIGMLIYMTVRFEFRFAMGAITALFHDSIIVVGLYVLTGRELNASIIAAVLTIIGYSVNDSIIVFDRIRENMVKAAKTGSVAKTQANYGSFIDLVNTSINETMSRTILTSTATMFVLIVLWQMGGGAISDFALAFLIGIVVGTYSSIFVAVPMAIALGKTAPTLRAS